MKVASVAEVKAHFSAYVRASEKEPVVVTRNGKPVAVVLAVTDEEEVERLLMAHSPRLQELLKAARQRLQAGKCIPNDEFWEQVEGKKAATKPRTKRKKRA